MSSANGSCLCGQAKIEVRNQPQMSALCHCTDCQQITGSTYSTNMIFAENDVTYSGTKDYTSQSDAKRSITSHFCGNCGSTLCRTGDAFPQQVVVKAGVVKGGLEMAKPGAELYVSQKPSWISEQAGAAQMQGMPQ